MLPKGWFGTVRCSHGSVRATVGLSGPQQGSLNMNCFYFRKPICIKNILVHEIGQNWFYIENLPMGVSSPKKKNGM